MKSDNVKAVVARKRPVKPVSTTPQKPTSAFKQTTNVSEAKKTPTKLEKPTPKLPQVQKPSPKANKPQQGDIDSLLNIAKVKRPEDEATLSLNIDTNYSYLPAGRLPGEKKKKLSRVERKERVMQKRIDAAQSKTNARKAQYAPKVQRTENVPKESSERPEQQEPSERSNRPEQPEQPEQPKQLERPKPTQQSEPPRQQSRYRKSESLFKDVQEVPHVGQRFVKPLNEIVFTGLPMASIGLHPHLVKTLADLLGITELTNVQQRAVPVALEKRDILVRSQTGSGKTLAYALPVVQQLQEMRPKIARTQGIFSLVIVPTRELAIQTLEVFIKLLKPFTWIVPTYITGGEKRKAEKARLRKGVNILIGTPGRICDHLLHTESFKLDQVKYLVLDEADRLYECGYEKDVKMIIDALNKPPVGKNPFKKFDDDDDEGEEDGKEQQQQQSKLQTILVSATLPSSVHQLAGLALKNPLFIDTSDKKNIELPKTIAITGKTGVAEEDAEGNATEVPENIVIPETVTQKYMLVPPKLRMVTLAGLIANETQKKSAKILIFMATENLVDYHYDVFVETLTRKVIDSDDEDDGNDSDAGIMNGSDSDLDDEDGLLDDIKMKAKKRRKTTFKPLLADVKLFK